MVVYFKVVKQSNNWYDPYHWSSIVNHTYIVVLTCIYRMICSYTMDDIRKGKNDPLNDMCLEQFIWGQWDISPWYVNLRLLLNNIVVTTVVYPTSDKPTHTNNTISRYTLYKVTFWVTVILTVIHCHSYIYSSPLLYLSIDMFIYSRWYH